MYSETKFQQDPTKNIEFPHLPHCKNRNVMSYVKKSAIFAVGDYGESSHFVLDPTEVSFLTTYSGWHISCKFQLKIIMIKKSQTAFDRLIWNALYLAGQRHSKDAREGTAAHADHDGAEGQVRSSPSSPSSPAGTHLLHHVHRGRRSRRLKHIT